MKTARLGCLFLLYSGVTDGFLPTGCRDARRLLGLRPTVSGEEAAPGAEFAEFLEAKRRRDAIRKSSLFKEFDVVAVETVVQMLERIPIEKGATVFSQGDQADALYFVASGLFDCYDESTGSNLATLGDGAVFGELGLLLDEKRALTVRASASESAVWKLSKKDFTRVAPGEKRDSLVGSFDLQEDYKKYLELRSRRRALEACTIFNLTASEILDMAGLMEKVTFLQDDVVIKEGNNGDDMYFVIDGSFTCYEEVTGELLKVCTAGDYFGELGLFYDTPRRASVKASPSVGGSAWKLSREDFFSVVQASSVDQQALGLLLKEYNGRGILEKLSGLKQYLSLKSRPVKKSVSLHSTLSTLSAGAYLATILPRMRPGFMPSGLPALFPMIGSFAPAITKVSIYRNALTMGLMSLTAVTGIFRLPRNVPRSRSLVFRLSALTTVYFTLLGVSTIGGLGPELRLFDTFSPLGRILTLGTSILTWVTLMQLFDEFIGGSQRGVDTVSGMDKPLALAAILTSFFALFSALTVFMCALALSTSEAYVRSVCRPMVANGWVGFLSNSNMLAVGQCGFGSLLMTLQYERKVSPAAGRFLGLTLLVLLSYDAVAASASMLFNPNISALDAYFFPLMKKAKLLWILFGSVSMTVANALRKRVASGRGRTH